MKKNHLSKMLIILIVLVSLVCLFVQGLYASEFDEALEQQRKREECVVIDVGHGGYDPGKVGVTGVKEKDINLEIALKLRGYLEEEGIEVVMTRTEDIDLDGLPDKFSKNADMRRRKEIINKSEADILVSIHQNAFQDGKVKGAQVFFHKASFCAKLLAGQIQQTLKEQVDPSNNRQIKQTGSYYVLKVTEMPAVIVECGFLTSKEEEAKLNTSDYQDQVAQAIYQGILNYFEEVEKDKQSD